VTEGVGWANCIFTFSSEIIGALRFMEFDRFTKIYSCKSGKFTAINLDFKWHKFYQKAVQKCCNIFGISVKNQ
jgi:hypothetical protein